MNLLSKIWVVPACCGLVACTGDTDPLTANVFDNIANIESGEYDNQIAAREAEAQAIINANNQSRGRINNLENQRAANVSTIASLRGDIATARAEIAQARARLAGNQAATARLAQLEGQVSAVQSDASSGGDPTVARAELGRIRAAVRALS